MTIWKKAQNKIQKSYLSISLLCHTKHMLTYCTEICSGWKGLHMEMRTCSVQVIFSQKSPHKEMLICHNWMVFSLKKNTITDARLLCWYGVLVGKVRKIGCSPVVLRLCSHWKGAPACCRWEPRWPNAILLLSWNTNTFRQACNTMVQVRYNKTEANRTCCWQNNSQNWWVMSFILD